jgi:hypothetical protein
MSPIVAVTFESADSSKQHVVPYEVTDLADYRIGVENGQHDAILATAHSGVLARLGNGYKKVSTTFDGEPLPD